MKKLYIISLLFIIHMAFGQVINFPDANFKTALLDHNPAIDINLDGAIDIKEAQNVNNTLYLNNKNIFSLDGIENFNNLQALNCSFNHLTAFNYSLPKLSYFYGVYNQITTFDTSNLPLLNSLSVENNLLTSIDLQNCPLLDGFYCANNLLTTINLCGTLAGWLDCSNNPVLTSVSVKNNVISGILWGDPPLGMLNFYNCPQLTTICYDEGELQSVAFGSDSINNINVVTDCSVNCIPLVVPRVEVQNQFVLSPNPVSDVLYVHSDLEIHTGLISVSNLLGQQVISIVFENSGALRIDTTTLATGIYLMNITSDKGTATKKFVRL